MVIQSSSVSSTCQPSKVVKNSASRGGSSVSNTTQSKLTLGRDVAEVIAPARAFVSDVDVMNSILPITTDSSYSGSASTLAA
jgi:hypothetical protein